MQFDFFRMLGWLVFFNLALLSSSVLWLARCALVVLGPYAVQAPFSAWLYVGACALPSAWGWASLVRLGLPGGPPLAGAVYASCL